VLNWRFGVYGAKNAICSGIIVKTRGDCCGTRPVWRFPPRECSGMSARTCGFRGSESMVPCECRVWSDALRLLTWLRIGLTRTDQTHGY
jgi:hypothetical protein